MSVRDADRGPSVPDNDGARADVLARHVRSRLARLEAPVRLPGLDLARGGAVIGMFAAHLTVTTPIRWGSPDTWTGIVDGRSSILFATAAGVSLAWSHGSGAKPEGERLREARVSLVGRGAVIWTLGILLMVLEVPVAVILPAFGLLFAVGAVVLGLPTRALIAVAAALAVTMPFVVRTVNEAVPADGAGLGLLVGWNYPFPLWAAFLVAGLAAGRLLAVSIGHAVSLLVTGTALTVIGYGLLGPVGDGASAGSDGPRSAGTWLLTALGDEPHASGLGEALGSGGFALAVIGGCTLIAMTPLRWVLWPVRALGSMPLTAYTTHLVVWAVWIGLARASDPGTDPLGDFRALDPFWPMTIGVALGCMVWAVLVGRGPLETMVSRTATPHREEERPDAPG